MGGLSLFPLVDFASVFFGDGMPGGALGRKPGGIPGGGRGPEATFEDPLLDGDIGGGAWRRPRSAAGR